MFDEPRGPGWPVGTGCFSSRRFPEIPPGFIAATAATLRRISMIMAEQKPIDQTKKMIADYPRVLVAGCGTCVTIYFTGGEREVAGLAPLPCQRPV